MKNDGGNVPLYVAAQDVKLDFGFRPQPVSSLAGLLQEEFELAAEQPEADVEGSAVLRIVGEQGQNHTRPIYPPCTDVEVWGLA
jgi:hypothetical protein